MSTTIDADDRARLSQEALANPVLVEAWAMLRAAYVAALRGCDAKDDLGRYRCAVALNVVDAVERHLRLAADSSQLDAMLTQDLTAPRRRWIPRF